MNPTAERHIDRVVAIEGGYVDDPKDSGGATIFGITERVARAYGYGGPMRDMPRSTAKDIYKELYWDTVAGDELAKLSDPVAWEMFDSAVNVGPERAGTWLQRSLNVLNDGERWYADIPVDGRVGKLTVAALRDYLKRRGNEGENVLLRALNSLQGEFYINLAEVRPKDQRFIYGWLKNRVEM